MRSRIKTELTLMCIVQHIKTWRMVCVAYDEQFQRRLAREYPTYLGQNRTKNKKESDD